MLVSPPASNLKLSDLYFDTDDILNLKLNADLVVLSACNTSSQGQGQFGRVLVWLGSILFCLGGSRAGGLPLAGGGSIDHDHYVQFLQDHIRKNR